MVVGNMLHEADARSLSKASLMTIEFKQRYLKPPRSALRTPSLRPVASFVSRRRALPQCYELPDSRFEHDHVCDLGTLHVCVRVESQSSAGAFQGSGQAYERIRRTFKADTGIKQRSTNRNGCARHT